VRHEAISLQIIKFAHSEAEGVDGSPGYERFEDTCIFRSFKNSTLGEL
jgi:hypothetical protein